MHVGKYVSSVVGKHPTSKTRAECGKHVVTSISEASVVRAVACLDISRGVRQLRVAETVLLCSASVHLDQAFNCDSERAPGATLHATCWVVIGWWESCWTISIELATRITRTREKSKLEGVMQAKCNINHLTDTPCTRVFYLGLERGRRRCMIVAACRHSK